MGRASLTIIISISIVSVLLAGTAQAHPAWGIVADRQGQIYFSDLRTVWKVDAQGRVSVFRPAADRHVHDLNIDDSGNLYGADNSYEPATQRFFSAIWKMTPAGEFSFLLDPTDDPPEGSSIWRDRAGNSYHATYFPENQLLILKRASNGNVSLLVGNQGTASNYRQGVPYSAGGMAFDQHGALYFVHGANVSKISTSGDLIPLVRDMVIESTLVDQARAKSPTQLFGIAVNAQGIAFVADYGNRRVLRITPDNQIRTSLSAELPWFPTGVACLGNDVYVLEHRVTPTHALIGTRVRKLMPDGRVIVLAGVGESTQSSIAGGSTNSQISVGLKQNRYMLIGAVTGIFALTVLIVLRLSRRVYNQRRADKKNGVA